MHSLSPSTPTTISPSPPNVIYHHQSYTLSWMVKHFKPNKRNIDLYEPSGYSPAADDLEVKLESGRWLLQRGDFRAR